MGVGDLPCILGNHELPNAWKQIQPALALDTQHTQEGIPMPAIEWMRKQCTAPILSGTTDGLKQFDDS